LVTRGASLNASVDYLGAPGSASAAGLTVDAKANGFGFGDVELCLRSHGSTSETCAFLAPNLHAGPWIAGGFAGIRLDVSGG
jgi:hypothetical protein